METPKNEAGQLTEEIMRIFWAEGQGLRNVLSTAQYNRVYEHVYAVLQRADEYRRALAAQPEKPAEPCPMSPLERLRCAALIKGNPCEGCPEVTKPPAGREG